MAATVGAAVHNLCDTFVGPFVSNEFNTYTQIQGMFL